MGRPMPKRACDPQSGKGHTMTAPVRRSRFSDEMHRQRGCVGKKRYGDQATAQAKVDAMRAKFRNIDKTLAPYHCRFCGLWHLGRSKKKG